MRKYLSWKRHGAFGREDDLRKLDSWRMGLVDELPLGNLMDVVTGVNC